MSLQTLANHLQNAGRDNDSVLVHMTPKEVSGLQTLAMAHGGSLTINPKTGLPEAGFLSAILPMVAGIALGPAGIGLSAMQAGLAAGAIGTVATGSLKKGLMAGLGAFGGAGLGAGLAGIGPAAATSGINAANAASMIAPAGTPFTMPTAASMVATPATAATLPTATGAAAGSPFGMAPPVNPAVQPQVTSMPSPAAPTNINVPGTDTFAGRIKNIGQNVGKLFGGSDEDAEYRKQFLKQYKPEMIASGLSLLSYQPEMEMEKERRKKFDPNYRAYSPGYFDPMYASSIAPGSTAERRYYAKEGGLMALAEGGAIEQMSKMNAVGANTGYPMANQMTPKYAASSEMPVSENIIKPQGDANIDPYTGEQKFDAGGATGINAREQGYVLHDTGKSFTPYVGGTGGTTQAKKEGVFTPTYNYRDPITGQYKYVEPKPEFTPFKKIPGLDKKNVRRVTADDVNTIFARYGVTPSEEQLGKAVGNRLSDQQIFDKYVKKSPQWSQKKPLTADEVNSYFQKVWGQNATPEEIAKFTRPNAKYNVAQLYDYAKKQPEYLQNINKLSESKFTTGQQTTAQTELEKQRATMPLKPVDISSAFQDVLGRPPSWDELQSFKQKPIVMEDLKKQLEGSKEYETELTKKFIPDIEYDKFGRGSIEGLPAYKTPEQQLGLGGFYEMMNQQLGQRGGYQPAPPPPPPMQDRLLPPPAPVTYQPIGQPTATPQGAPVAPQIDPVTGLPMNVQTPQIDPMTGLPVNPQTPPVGMAGGGLSHLGDYSDGGRLLKGPGDGVSDSIPASISGRQPARLADGEFVIPARIVSEIGNGSTDAGARKLYAMMDRIQKARSKSVGKGKVAVDSNSDKYLPA